MNVMPLGVTGCGMTTLHCS